MECIADLKMPENGLLATREAHVAGKRQLASNAGRASPYAGNGDDRRTAEAHQNVVEGAEAARAGRQARGVLRAREEIVVGEEEARHRAVEYDHLDRLVALDRRDDRVELRNGLRTEDVERRVIERDAPIRN